MSEARDHFQKVKGLVANSFAYQDGVSYELAEPAKRTRGGEMREAAVWVEMGPCGKCGHDYSFHWLGGMCRWEKGGGIYCKCSDWVRRREVPPRGEAPSPLQ